MDIARLGVSIDPKDAESGSKRAVAAAARMASGMETEGKKANKAGEHAGEGALAGAAKIENAADKSKRAFERMRDEAGRYASAMSQNAAGVTRSVDQSNSAFARLANMAGMFANVVAGIEAAGKAYTFLTGKTQAAATATTAASTANTAAAVSANTAAAGTTRLGMAARVTGGGLGFMGAAAGGAALGFGALMAAILPIVAALAAITLAFKAVSLAVDLFGDSINVAAKVEVFEVAVTALTGSADEARRVLDQLRKQSEVTGIAMQDSAATVRRFISLGFDTDKALALNDSIENIAGAFGLTADEAKLLGMALGQVQSKGVASMEELRQQIAEKGIPIFEALATSIGVTQARLIDMISAGEVSADAVMKVFLNYEGAFSKARGGAERMGMTFEGMVNRIKAAWSNTLLLFGGPVANSLKPLLDDVLRGVQGLQDGAAKFGERVAAMAINAQALVRIMQEPATETDVSGFELAMKAAWDTIKQYAAQVVDFLGILLANRMQIAGEKLMESVNEMKTPAFWQGLTDALITAGTAFVDKITLGLFPVLEKLKSFLKSGADDLANLHNGIMAGDTAKVNRALFGGTEPTSELPQTTSLPDNWVFENSDNFVGPPDPGALGANPLLPALEDSTTKAITATEAWEQSTQNLTETQEQLLAKLAAKTQELEAGMTGPTNPEIMGPPDPKPASLPPTETNTSKAGRRGGGGGGSDLDAEAARIIKSIQTPQEEFDAQIANLTRLRDAGLLTADQYSRAFQKAEADFKASMTGMGNAQDAMLSGAQAPLQQLVNDWGNVTGQLQQMSVGIASSLSDNITGALTSITNGTASASEAFNQMALNILNDINAMIIRLLVQLAISRALGMVGVTVPAAGVMHTGGTVGGQGGASRPVDARSFNNAPRFAFGGKVGTSGESPIVAEAGETVLTREQAGDIKDRLGRSEAKASPQGQAVTIVNVQNPQEMERYLTANPNTILNVISRNAGKVRHLLKQ